VAAFGATPTSGCAPLTANFTDQSTGSPTSWSWTFGDGGTSTDQNPSHQYANIGSYDVTLTVSNGCGSDDETKTNYITVSQAPVAAFSATPTSGCAPLTVHFTDQSTGNSTSWNWTFGDGGTSTLQNPSHQYANAGSYNVTLTMSNACGSDDETKTNYITVSQAPVAAFSATPTSGCAPLTVNFADQSTGNPTSWSWTFGNGGTSTAPNPTHSYASAGTYTVSLTVSNACGSDTETKTDYITVYARPTATALSNSPICQGSTIALSGGPVGMTSYNWTGPNGFSSSSQNPTIPNATTLNAGIYYLTVTDGGCTSDPASTVVVVNNRPTANAGADREIPEGSSVVIGGGPTASNGTPPYTYSWTPTTSLNDAGIANPTASPAVTTTYTVIVTDSKGCTDADDVTVTLAHGCCICGFVYRAGTTEALGGWEVILEKKTSPWHEVQRTTTDADGKYCFCGLENGEYRVSEVVKPGWDQVSPVPNEHVVTLPEGASDPEYGPFLNFENEHPASPPTVGWETYPINKVRVLLPWIALCAAIMVGVSLLVLRRRRAQT
jgi:PKD repeat protein